MLFHFPQSIRATESRYLRPIIRLEIGARSDHWPSVPGTVSPYAAEEFSDLFKQPTVTVKTLAPERTFWEKATILHMWAHADPSRKLRDRQSRHYYDCARLHQRGIGMRAINKPELLTAVARHKSIFFAASWARYDLAIPGTLKLVPPRERHAELAADYASMSQEMIFGDAPTLEEILDCLREIERAINNQ